MRVSDLTRGAVVRYENGLFQIVDWDHITPGNKRAHYQMKMKNLLTGRGLQRRFSPSDDLDIALVERKDVEYLYADGAHHVFMDQETYEQTTLSEETLRDALPYIALNATVALLLVDGAPVAVELPASVVLKITHTNPGARGDTVSNVKKPATLETGLEVKVPLHINQGDLVKVDTRTGEFIERVNR